MAHHTRRQFLRAGTAAGAVASGGIVLAQTTKRSVDDTKVAGEAIRRQIANYTAALDAADIDLASRIWRTSADVTFIHPAGHARGWEQVKEIYKFFGAAFSERKLTVRDVSVHVNGPTAWAEFYWNFLAKQSKDGSAVKTEGRETQIYEKAGNRWQLVHVHYSGPPIAQ